MILFPSGETINEISKINLRNQSQDRQTEVRYKETRLKKSGREKKISSKYNSHESQNQERRDSVSMANVKDSSGSLQERRFQKCFHAHNKPPLLKEE